MQLRRATMEDMYEMQHCNLRCLPENYNLRYFYYHILSWPQLLYVQQDYHRNTVGYVMGKMDDEESAEKRHGHITSVAVLRSHRKLGIASRVMRATMKEMDKEYQAHFCSLHVRETNEAALHLYQDTLNFRCAGVEEKYYVDEENAYHMKYYFHQANPGLYVGKDKSMAPKPIAGEEKGGRAGEAAASGSAERGGRKKGHSQGGGDGGTAEKHNQSSEKEREAAMAELLDELNGKPSNKGGKGKGGGGGGKGAGASKKGNHNKGK